LNRGQILLSTNFSGNPNPTDTNISLHDPTPMPFKDQEVNPDDASRFEHNNHDFAVGIHENQEQTVFGNY